jgi:hypothetical protein
MTDLPPPPQPPPTQVPPPAQPPRRGGVRWVLIGAGGCLVIILLLFVGFAGCLAAIGGGGGEQGAGEQQEREHPSRQKGPRGKVGDTLQAGKVSWQLTTARQATELKSAFGDKKQGNFVIVDFIFTNNGDEATTLDTASLVLIDSEGRESESDPDAYEYIDPSKDIFLENINPGVSKAGEAIFTVAPDAHGFVLRAGDTVLFEDKNCYFELGF